MSLELRELLERVDGGAVGEPDLQAIERRSRQLRSVRAAGVAAAVLLVVVGGVIGIVRVGDVPNLPVIGQIEEPDEAPRDAPTGWERLEDPPYRSLEGHSLVATGGQLVMFGGVEAAGVFHAEGAVYDFAAGRWRELPGPDLEGRHGHVAVWTGDEMLVYGGDAETLDGADAGAAYDPASGRWRRLSSFQPLLDPQGVWTGEALLVLGTPPTGGSEQIPASVLGVYDPTTDRWTEAATSPHPARYGATLVWTGEELIVWGGTSGGDDPAASPGAHGIAYDPTADRWRELPDAPIEPRLLHSAVWTGQRMVVWGGTSDLGRVGHELADGAAYDPATDTWTALPSAPLEPRANHLAVVLDGRLVILGGNQRTGGSTWHATTDGAVLDLEDDTWNHLGELDQDVAGAPAATVGDTTIITIPHDTQGNPTFQLRLPVTTDD